MGWPREVAERRRRVSAEPTDGQPLGSAGRTDRNTISAHQGADRSEEAMPAAVAGTRISQAERTSNAKQTLLKGTLD
jgi:hypothetical protein